jgi:hypothetical protein
MNRAWRVVLWAGFVILAAVALTFARAEAKEQRKLRQSQLTQPWAWSTTRSKNPVVIALGRGLLHVISNEHKLRRITTRRHGYSLSLSTECQTARRLGGPCGCYASEQIFGHSVRNLWLANAWLRFPRTTPAPGTAAIWPGRHVAQVVAVNSDKTVVVNDSWNAHHVVRMAGLVFVKPR